MSKNSIIIIALLFQIVEAQAQLTTETIIQKFNSYQAVRPKVSVSLILNQEKFSPGDTIYFKAYLLKEDLTYVEGKQLINLYLVNSEGKIALSNFFLTYNGLGNNQLVIPATLDAGYYEVTAFSNWMRNFDAAFFFKKQIQLVNKNSLRPRETRTIKAVAEGGHFIRDIQNKIIVKTIYPNQPLEVIDEKGNVISQTSTDANGVSALHIIPKKKTSYKVLLPNDSVSSNLPEVEDDGVSLSLDLSSNKEYYKVLLNMPVGSSIRFQDLVLIVNSKGKVCHSVSLTNSAELSQEFLIPKASIPDGVAHISLLNHAGSLLASRDFFSFERPVIAKISSTKDSFQTREKVKIEVYLTDDEGKPLQGEFAARCTNEMLDGKKRSNDFMFDVSLNYLTEFLSDNSGYSWPTNVDDLMILSMHPDPWKDILFSNTTKPAFNFTNLIQKTGKIYFSDTEKPLPYGTDVMFYFQRSKLRYQTKVEKGKVWMAVPDLYGEDELMILAETFYYIGGIEHGQEIPNVRIEWEKEELELQKPTASIETNVEDVYASYKLRQKLINESYGFFKKNKATIGNLSSIKDFESEIKGADVTINVQEYTLFPTMVELIKEVIPSLQYRKEKGKDVLLVNLPESMWAMKTGNPVYIIDNIATKNTDFFLSLNPVDLISVKVVTNAQKLQRFGLMGKNGFVIVHTKQGDVRELLDDPAKQIVGLNKKSDFINHNHSNPIATESPDFRSTIYWNPSIKTDSNGKTSVEFYWSDDIGKMDFRIDGVSLDGRPFSASQIFHVELASKKQ